MALYSIHNFTPVHSETVYKIDSSLIRCSRILSLFLHNICEKTYKIVKRDSSRMIGKLKIFPTIYFCEKVMYVKQTEEWVPEWEIFNRYHGTERVDNDC